MSQKRYYHLDSLRGIAALIVVFSHYFAAFFPYTIFGAKNNYQQHSFGESIVFFPPFGLIINGHLAICLFFILSGYVLSYSFLGNDFRKRKIMTSMIKRPIRLGGLVLFTVILSSCLWYLEAYFNGAVADISNSIPWFSRYWKGEFELNTLIRDISTSLFSRGPIYNVPLWTINIELYGSMMVFLFVLIFGGCKYRLLVLSVLLFFSRGSLYLGFILGVVIADLVKNHDSSFKKTSNRYFSVLLVVLFLFFSSYPHNVSDDFIKETIFGFLPNDRRIGGGYPMVSALFLFILVSTNDRIKVYLNRPYLKYFGKISYAIYAIHFLVLGSVSSWMFLVMNKYFGYELSFLIVLTTGLAIIIFCAHWLTIYVDKPAIRAASYVEKKIIYLLDIFPFRKFKKINSKHFI